MPSHEQIMAEVAELRDALDHIARVARKSRSQTRRIRWIQLRAEGALEGTDEWRTVELPRDDETRRDRLKARVAELENQVAGIGDAEMTHHPPELEAVDLEAVGWFVRTKRTDQDSAGWFIADCSTAAHRKEWARLFAASLKLLTVVRMIDAHGVASPLVMNMAKEALAAVEGRVEQ